MLCTVYLFIHENYIWNRTTFNRFYKRNQKKVAFFCCIFYNKPRLLLIYLTLLSNGNVVLNFYRISKVISIYRIHIHSNILQMICIYSSPTQSVWKFITKALPFFISSQNFNSKEVVRFEIKIFTYKFTTSSNQ